VSRVESYSRPVKDIVPLARLKIGARAVRLVRITKPARPSRRRTFWERPSHALPDRGIEGDGLRCNVARRSSSQRLNSCAQVAILDR
jgi:hypothetical protein